MENTSCRNILIAMLTLSVGSLGCSKSDRSDEAIKIVRAAYPEGDKVVESMKDSSSPDLRMAAEWFSVRLEGDVYRVGVGMMHQGSTATKADQAESMDQAPLKWRVNVGTGEIAPDSNFALRLDQGRARGELAAIETVIQLFKIDHDGRAPDSLEELIVGGKYLAKIPSSRKWAYDRKTGKVAVDDNTRK